MALAKATPPASKAGSASPAAECRALATVTAVDDARPPAAPATRMPRPVPSTQPEITKKRNRGEHDGNQPYFARIHSAKRSDRVVGHNWQNDECHGQKN